MTAYYNEIDPFAAEWLRQLINAGHIAPGDVDTRSIVDVRPDDLRGYTQCHFFAGIGVWSYALRRAGWPDHRPVWTGSCPCQPFSAAGAGAGFADERHLWPHFHWLIDQCRPPVIAGEQVASKDADAWIDLVQDDLEALDYAFGAVPFPSASVGAPHIRDRNYWMANAHSGQQYGEPIIRGVERDGQDTGRAQGGRELEPCRDVGGVGDAHGSGRETRNSFASRDEPRPEQSADTGELGGVDDDDDAGLEGQRGRHQAPLGHGSGEARPVAETGQSGGMADADDHKPWSGRDGGSAPGEGLRVEPGRCGDASGLADPQSDRRSEQRADLGGRGERSTPEGLEQRFGCRRLLRDYGRPGPTNGFWRDADWLHCRDGKWRPVEPGTFPLAHGAPARVGRLRGYGNAINAVQAQIGYSDYDVELMP